MKSSILTLLLSVALSVTATLLLEHFHTAPASPTIRAENIELVDHTGRVRGALRFESGRPEVVLLDERGLTAASLWLGSNHGAGLFLGTNEHPEGKPSAVWVGSIALGDTNPPDSNQRGWGVLVQNHGRSTLVGVPDQGPLWLTPK